MHTGSPRVYETHSSSKLSAAAGDLFKPGASVSAFLLLHSLVTSNGVLVARVGLAAAPLQQQETALSASTARGFCYQFCLKCSSNAPSDLPQPRTHLTSPLVLLRLGLAIACSEGLWQVPHQAHGSPGFPRPPHTSSSLGTSPRPLVTALSPLSPQAP